MAITGLRAVTNELKTLSDKQDETTGSVNAVVKMISDQIKQAERSRLDQLEAAAEASRSAPIRPKGGSGPGATPGGTDVSLTHVAASDSLVVLNRVNLSCNARTIPRSTIIIRIDIIIKLIIVITTRIM